MGEIWMPVVGYEGFYEVSSLGRIRSLRFGKIMIQEKSKRFHYLSIGLKLPGVKKKLIRVHRLVANAFIPNPENKPYVNHKDHDKRNNCVSNLEWCTHAENMAHGTTNPNRKSGGLSAGRGSLAIDTKK